jgi:hypothetical protein
MLRPRLVLVLLFIGVAVSGAFDGYHLARNEATPAPLNLALTFMLGAISFAWYYFDAAQIPYRRPKLLDVAVIFLAPIAVPFYLIRSRPSGSRLKAVGLFLGVFVLLIFTAITTTTLVSYVLVSA